MCWGTSFACLCSWDMVLSVVVHCLNKNRWNDIQSSDIKHQRPVELWCIDRLQEQRERWLRGWKSWKKEIDEADRRQAAWGLLRIVFGVWGSGVYVSQDLGEKLLPWGKEWRSEWERCKGMCGALRVWMIEINQVPSWPSCQSIAFLSAPLQCDHAYYYVFFFKRDPVSGAPFEYAWLVSFRRSVSVFVSPCSCVRAHVWMVMNNQTLLGYLDFL